MLTEGYPSGYEYLSDLSLPSHSVATLSSTTDQLIPSALCASSYP